MSNASIIVAYDGEALKDNSMDIQELALALTGIGEIFQEANFILNGASTKTTVKVKADFQKGSFEILFDVYQQTVSFLDVFNSGQITGAVNLAAIIGLGVGSSKGLIWLFKKLKNKSVINIKEEQDKIILITQEEEIIIERNLYELYTNTKVRKALYRTLKPLEKEGIDIFQIKNEKKEVINEVKKEELPYFSIQPMQEQILESPPGEVFLNIVSVSFREGNKWKFTDGQRDFFATINDLQFLYGVNNNLISFSKDDNFKVLLKMKQWNTEEGLKTEYIIEKVVEHKAAKQLKLELFKQKEN